MRTYRIVEGAARIANCTADRLPRRGRHFLHYFHISESAVDVNLQTAIPNLASRHLSFDVNDNQFKTCASTDANLLQFVPAPSLLHSGRSAAKSAAFSSRKNLASSGQRLKATLGFLIFNVKVLVMSRCGCTDCTAACSKHERIESLIKVWAHSFVCTAARKSQCHFVMRA